MVLGPSSLPQHRGQCAGGDFLTVHLHDDNSRDSPGYSLHINEMASTPAFLVLEAIFEERIFEFI
jgi:hypothetical protein